MCASAAVFAAMVATGTLQADILIFYIAFLLGAGGKINLLYYNVP